MFIVIRNILWSKNQSYMKFVAMETRFWIHKPISPNFWIELNPNHLVIHALAKQVWKLSKSSEGKTPICPYIMRVYCGAIEALAIKKKASFLPSFKVFFSFFPHFLHSFYGNPILCLSMLCFTNCKNKSSMPLGRKLSEFIIILCIVFYFLCRPTWK